VLRSIPALLLLGTANPVAAAQQQQGQPTFASVGVSPEARDLLERDWVLTNWALKFYDRDHDILLSGSEAQEAAAEFRKIADANGDGRVTQDEYRAARAFILARY
jgi:hypothetical protein